jgi:hypothetical protein
MLGVLFDCGFIFSVPNKEFRDRMLTNPRLDKLSMLHACSETVSWDWAKVRPATTFNDALPHYWDGVPHCTYIPPDLLGEELPAQYPNNRAPGFSKWAGNCKTPGESPASVSLHSIAEEFLVDEGIQSNDVNSTGLRLWRVDVRCWAGEISTLYLIGSINGTQYSTQCIMLMPTEFTQPRFSMPGPTKVIGSLV